MSIVSKITKINADSDTRNSVRIVRIFSWKVSYSVIVSLFYVKDIKNGFQTIFNYLFLEHYLYGTIYRIASDKYCISNRPDTLVGNNYTGPKSTGNARSRSNVNCYCFWRKEGRLL
jgi:hypothetical protein